METAQGISREWAELTWVYIMTGTTIDDQLESEEPEPNIQQSNNFLHRIRAFFN